VSLTLYILLIKMTVIGFRFVVYYSEDRAKVKFTCQIKYKKGLI